MNTKKNKIKKFYAKGMEFVARIEAKEEDGTPIYEQREDGSYKRNKRTGAKIPVMVSIKFVPLFIDPKKDTWCCYETDDQNVIEQLLLKDKDPNNPVICEENYERGKDPVAYDLEIENKELKAKLAALLAKEDALNSKSKK